jgi:cell division septal protein FtsQ
VNLPEREPHKLGRQTRPKQMPPIDAAPEPELETPDLDQIEETEESVVTDESTGWLHGKRAPWLFLGVLLVLGAAAYFALGYEQDLALERIVVEGNYQLTDKEIINLADIDRSQKFYEIDLKEITANLMKHSLVKAAYPSRESNPATIVLRIEERKPVAMIRVASTGEAVVIDADGNLLRPKKMTGLKDPASLLTVPLLSGITEKDTASWLAMSRLVMKLSELDSGALVRSADELKKTPTGAYVLYTSEAHTPVFIGSPKDEPFVAALDAERDPEGVKAKREEPLFEKQVRLLSSMWKSNIVPALRKGGVLYVDARFDGQVIVKTRHGSSGAPNTALNHAHSDSARVAVDTNKVSNTRPIAQGH